MVGLGEAASVVAVIQISERILSLCTKYYLKVRDAKEDIKRLQGEVEGLRDVLKKVLELVEGPGAARLPTSGLLAGRIQQCSSELQDLGNRLDPAQKGAMKRLGFRALKWPFTGEDVNKSIAMLERHKTTLNLALNADQT